MLGKFDRTKIAGIILIATFLAIGVGAGVAIGQLPANPGDLLSFAGALLGAGLTIMGALFIFEYQRHQSREASRDVMKRLIQEVLDEIHNVRSPKPVGEVEDHVPAILVLNHVGLLRDRIDAVKLARRWFTPDTAGMVRAFAEIDSLEIDKEAIRDDLRPNLFYGGVPDLERHLGILEARTNVALTQLDL